MSVCDLYCYNITWILRMDFTYNGLKLKITFIVVYISKIPIPTISDTILYSVLPHNSFFAYNLNTIQ